MIAVILAAGLSKRFGGKKLLEKINNKPMILHTAELVGTYEFRQKVLVYSDEEVKKAVQASASTSDFIFVHNTHAEEGLSTSIKLVVETLFQNQVIENQVIENQVIENQVIENQVIENQVIENQDKESQDKENQDKENRDIENSNKENLNTNREGKEGIMFFVGDQPFLNEGTIRRLDDAFTEGKGSIIVPIYGANRGNPVIFSTKWVEELKKLEGDVGGRIIIRQNSSEVWEVPITDIEIGRDIDTKEEYNAVQAERISELHGKTE
ncbi:MAG: molybdenum cofactor cytidylyltransferase [Anaerocolumna sp.]|nr:molybdenum cofactor cytidylyltransferase [Anaerocolumna sp.]